MFYRTKIVLIAQNNVFQNMRILQVSTDELTKKHHVQKLISPLLSSWLGCTALTREAGVRIPVGELFSINASRDEFKKVQTISSATQNISQCGLMVMTFASHAKGSQFDPGH